MNKKIKLLYNDSDLEQILTYKILKNIEILSGKFGNHDLIEIYCFNDVSNISKAVGKELPIWTKGVCINDKIYLIKYININYFSIEDFFEVLLHEIVHVLVKRKITEDVPCWVNEGLAVYYSNNNYNIDLLDNIKNYDDSNLGYSTPFFYEISYLKIKKILDNYGEVKMLSWLTIKNFDWNIGE